VQRWLRTGVHPGDLGQIGPVEDDAIAFRIRKRLPGEKKRTGVTDLCVVQLDDLRNAALPTKGVREITGVRPLDSLMYDKDKQCSSSDGIDGTEERSPQSIQETPERRPGGLITSESAMPPAAVS